MDLALGREDSHFSHLLLWPSWDQLRSELGPVPHKPNPGVRGEYQSLQVLELVSQLEELGGGEQDGVEGVHHGGSELEVFLPKQDVCHRVEDVLCIQQEAELPRKQARKRYILEAFQGPRGTCSLLGL